MVRAVYYFKVILELELRLISYTESEDEQVLLGITIDSNLTFENHINSICKKANKELNALARITP